MEANKIQHLEEVDHSYIRYANVWEDPYLLLEGLDVQPQHKVLSIASAGDNAFALLSKGPKICVAIDLNRVQLYLVELKKVAIEKLNQEEYIRFVGFRSDENRWSTFQRLKAELTSSTRIYWEARKEEIKSGIIWNGKFEKYLKTFATKLLPWIHSKKKVKALFATKSKSKQEEFFEAKWNTWRWRFLFKIFFSKRVMGLLGRDPAFLAQVKVNVAETILDKAKTHLSSESAQTNPMLYYCLNGDFGSELPFYCKEENYYKVKKNIGSLEIEYGYAQDASAKYGNFDRFNLSNIFEYMNDEIFRSTAEALAEISNPDAKFAYWNLMIERQISKILSNFTRDEDESNWSTRDQGFFYMQYIVEQLNAR